LALAIKFQISILPVYAFFKLNPIAIANIFSQENRNIFKLGAKVVNIRPPFVGKQELIRLVKMRALEATLVACRQKPFCG
jgi:hypothetical protein